MLLLSFASLNGFIFILRQRKIQEMPLGEWRMTTLKEEEGSVVLCFQQHSENFSEDCPDRVMFWYLCLEKEFLHITC